MIYISSYTKSIFLLYTINALNVVQSKIGYKVALDSSKIEKGFQNDAH